MKQRKMVQPAGAVACLILILFSLHGCGGVSSGATGQQLTVTTQSLPNGTVGVGYSATLSASGGTTPYTWSISAGSLPGRLTLNASTGLISGTPTGTGTSNFTVKVVDSESPPQTATAQLSITVNAAGQGPIKHVVIIFQENRTPDNLFQGLCISPYGSQSACGTGQNQYDIAQSGENSSGQMVTLQPSCLGTDSCGGPPPDIWDMGHNHANFLTAWNSGAQNGFDLDAIFCPQGGQNCAPANPEYYYVQPSDVQPYLTLAQTYTFADHMFQTNQGPSFPAHQYIIAGTSAYAQQPGYDIADNPTGGGDTYGCIAPPAAYVKIVNTTTGDYLEEYPCTDHPTLTDLLDAAGISWKYYTPSAGSIWTGPVVIEHICGPNEQPPNGTACVGADWTNHVDIQGQNNDILNDIANNQLAAVSWVIPHELVSDHSGTNDGTGPSWVSAVVNAIGNSPYWADTAILIAWDDWGGWYDHVTPPQPFFNQYEMGFRVPLLVVSPYAKAAYISKDQHDFGSILHFIETTFVLGYVDGNQYADARADDLSDCFNYSQNPLPFQQVEAPLGAKHFLNHTEPAGPPDED